MKLFVLLILVDIAVGFEHWQQGLKGQQGYQDQKGLQGQQGFRDQKEFLGQQGEQGYQGKQGQQGLQGQQKYKGQQEYQGKIEIQDKRGYQGQQGQQRFLGQQSFQGQRQQGLKSQRGYEGQFGDKYRFTQQASEHGKDTGDRARGFRDQQQQKRHNVKQGDQFDQNKGIAPGQNVPLGQQLTQQRQKRVDIGVQTGLDANLGGTRTNVGTKGNFNTRILRDTAQDGQAPGQGVAAEQNVQPGQQLNEGRQSRDVGPAVQDTSGGSGLNTQGGGQLGTVDANVRISRHTDKGNQFDREQSGQFNQGKTFGKGIASDQNIPLRQQRLQRDSGFQGDKNNGFSGSSAGESKSSIGGGQLTIEGEVRP